MMRIVKVVAGVVIASLVAFTVGLYIRDLPWSLYSVLMFLEDTKYAPEFRESRFRVVKVGMTSDEVLEILGAPLRIQYYAASGLHLGEKKVDPEKVGSVLAWPSDAAEEMTFEYSMPGAQYDNYFIRVVGIDRDGAVVVVGSNFYTD